MTWDTVTFSLELPGIHLHRRQQRWTAFPSHTLPTSLLCWSCCAISVSLTPCWGAASAPTEPLQVPALWHGQKHSLTPGNHIYLCKSLLMNLIAWCSWWPALWGPARVGHQLLRDLQPSWGWFSGCLWVFTKVTFHCQILLFLIF